ncbi:protein ENHANCED DISEASE RESISTANCE 2-like isoform X2 [Silene latifolia]|uniref:protein ENHANCED DISEASE RESISTANCE 2-like isoform X2 n=1 Tax=Silene latifolia TaxID=37657 RepID=UPI003D77FFD9
MNPNRGKTGTLSSRRSLSDGEGMMLSLTMNNGELKKPNFEYFGWIYHLGFNKLGHEYCHLRFLFIRGKYVEMYTRDPHDNPGIKPIRRGVAGHTLLVKDLGHRQVNNHGDVYVLQFYNRLDESKKGEIACATPEESRRWMDAFLQAKNQAEYHFSNGGSVRDKLNLEADLNLDGHRHKMRRYAHGFKKLIKIGQGPEPLLRQSSALLDNVTTDGFLGADGDADAIEAHTWKCVCTMNGIRIFEDVGDPKAGKGVLVKSVGIIETGADTVFDILMSLEPSRRYEWDMLTSDLELVESVDGQYDIVYGTYDPKYFTWWSSKRDFVFSRQWFRGQDGTYTILQLPAVHKKRPPKSGYQRTKINPSTWEIKSLAAPADAESERCLVTNMLEIQSDSWGLWKKTRTSKFEKSIPYALLCQVSGLKEYIGANPSMKNLSAPNFFDSPSRSVSVSGSECDDDVVDEFYDAIAAESSEDEESENGVAIDKKDHVTLKNVSWAVASLSLKTDSDHDANKQLDSTIPPVPMDPAWFCGSLREGKDDNDTDCWTNPGGSGFMIRGKTYLDDGAKVRSGDPLLKLIAVDWLKADQSIDKIALRPSCVVQSEAGRKLPFILVFNLQIPAKPNYNLVFYYAADRPVNKDSLLGKFVDGTDSFRDSRLKLIPSIVKGYWMVKRAVGTKACLLGKAVTCKYLRQDNFLEIDVDIGSSAVARSVVGLVLGYVTSLVVDLAILIEANEEAELPEYLLGIVRLSCVRLDSALGG